jgi:hypothetical protein
MKNFKEVTAVLGDYTNAKGEVKKRYMKIGAIVETKHGQMLTIETIPLNWNGWAYLNDPYDANNPKKPAQKSSGGSGFDDMDDVPF